MQQHLLSVPSRPGLRPEPALLGAAARGVYLPGPGVGQHGGSLLRSISHAPGFQREVLGNLHPAMNIGRTKQIQGFFMVVGVHFWRRLVDSFRLFTFILSHPALNFSF